MNMYVDIHFIIIIIMRSLPVYTHCSYITAWLDVARQQAYIVNWVHELRGRMHPN